LGPADNTGARAINALTGEKILVAWERSRGRPEQEAALVLLALVLPEHSAEELSALPLAERNELLLEMRARSLGNRMEGTGNCSDCGVRLEFALDARTLVQGLREQRGAPLEEVSGITMRPTNTQDLLACAAARSEAEACSILLERTTRLPRPELQSLPGPAVAALMEQFERLNAAAEIQVGLHCDACGARPQLDLDIAHYVVREVAAAARRLLAEIHELASAYGWSERSIARMTHERRAVYLEMLHA
jgi:hypothetical protein